MWGCFLICLLNVTLVGQVSWNACQIVLQMHPELAEAVRVLGAHTYTQVDARKSLAEARSLACKQGPCANGEHAVRMEPVQHIEVQQWQAATARHATSPGGTQPLEGMQTLSGSSCMHKLKEWWMERFSPKDVSLAWVKVRRFDELHRKVYS